MNDLHITVSESNQEYWSERNKEQMKTCKWTETDECYETDCGKEFIMNYGTPKENDLLYCCFCGRLLEEVKLELEEDASENLGY